jgi:hypothetical protein
MSGLGEQLDEARATVARLEREAAQATCVQLGRHTWVCIGGCNAGCGLDCSCSVPVHKCSVCKDCDYGENAEASEIRAKCKLDFEP